MSTKKTTVTTTLDSKAIAARIETKAENVTPVLASMIMQDSNYFVPIKTSTLEKSAIINSQINEGLIIWRTPYARAQYYGDNFDHSKQYNPNACSRWYDAARARWLSKWERLVNDMFKRR